jgi:hypothetical protein
MLFHVSFVFFFFFFITMSSKLVLLPRKATGLAALVATSTLLGATSATNVRLPRPPHQLEEREIETKKVEEEEIMKEVRCCLLC